jgi:hypothetical protein
MEYQQPQYVVSQSQWPRGLRRRSAAARLLRLWVRIPQWTRNRIVWILRMDPVYIPNEWTILSQFKLCPAQRHRTVLWIVAHMMWCRTREGWTLSAQEYSDFLRKTRWKANRDTRRATQVGNCQSLNYLTCAN